jgi:hypothetical protein
MTIAISVNGSRVVVPGTYSQFLVDNSLASIAPGPRNVVVLGEATKGAPGSELDIRGVYFNDFNTLRDYYGAGTIVDAARALFTSQASPAFSGSIGNVYVYKTNNSGLASSPILQGATAYGTVSASEYGEDGNLIRIQVRQGTTEVLPSFTAHWVPKAEAANFSVRVSGGAEQDVSVASEELPSAIVASINGLTGVAASGGATLEIIDPVQVTASEEIKLTVVSGSRVSLSMFVAGGGTASAFQGADIDSVVAGTVIYIPAGSAIKGAGSENVGAYAVVSANSSLIVMDKISSVSAGVESTPIAPAAVGPVSLSGDQSIASGAEVMAFAPVTVTVDAVTVDGIGASLEMYMAAGNKSIAQRWYSADLQKTPVSATAAMAGSVALSASAGTGTFSITGGAFSVIPSAGQTLWIPATSVLAGAGSANLGAWIVVSAGSTSIVARKVAGNGISVASTALAGAENPFLVQNAFASTSIASYLHISNAEAQVFVEASRQTDGKSFPTTLVGGRVVFMLSYTGSATATMSISNGILTTSCADVNGNLRINLGQFATLADLVAYINTKAGYFAKSASLSFNALAPSVVLDEVQAVGIGSGVAGVPAYGCRVKTDYYSFAKFLADNEGLITFAESAALLFKCGLPSVMATASFLEGGSIGATNDAAIADGYDAALKVNAVNVLPLFSRDASKDIEDNLTNEASTYTIDAILQGAKAHALTASNALNRKERFASVSFHGSFADTKLKAAALSSERCQMAFQMIRTVAADGSVKWFLPWMEACALVAGRTQAALGIPLLRKSFTVTDVKHIGDISIYSDTLVRDFDPDTKDLDEAIEAGLVVLKPVTGFGIRMESPDLSTRSRENDPKAWVYERMSVLFVCDQVISTSRTVMDNFIGSRDTDVSPALLTSSLNTALNSFVLNSALRGFSIDSVKKEGTGYKLTVSILPSEAIEFITLDVVATRE